MEKLEVLRPEECLSFGNRTMSGENVKRLASMVDDNIQTEEKIFQILDIMSKEVPLRQDPDAKNKFNRSAEEICSGGTRNGCSDSSTLFVTLCREKGIPAFQIITESIPALKNGDYERGHYYSACFIPEAKEWKFIETNLSSYDKNKGLKRYERRIDINSRIINQDSLIIAFVKDYSDFELDGLRINSSADMIEIHKMFYKKYLEEKEEDIER